MGLIMMDLTNMDLTKIGVIYVLVKIHTLLVVIGAHDCVIL